LFDKKMFDQLRFLDELVRENFGIKRFENGLGNLVPGKKVSAYHENYAAVSPFVLEEIRDNIHFGKQLKMDDYESRIENSLFKTINESWINCKIDFIGLKHECTLWRLDNGADPRLYVYLTLWTTEADLEKLKSEFDVPDASALIAVVLNEQPDAAGGKLKEKVRNCSELSLICPLNQKEVKVETLVGSTTTFSTEIIESVTRALNPSGSSRKATRLEPKGVNQDAQVGWEQLRPKISLGSQDTREIIWIPTKERNSNIGILGDTESGKTQMIKRILLELRKIGIPFLAIDTSGDYLRKDSTNVEFGTVVSVNEISVNPLELDNTNTPRDREYRVLEILDTVYGLKDWEVAYIRRAIKKSYETKGIVEDSPRTWSKVPPTFQDIRNALELIGEEGKGNARSSTREILQKIGPAFGHQLFSQAKTRIPFEKLVTESLVIDLSGFQNDGMKTLATEFLLEKIPSFTKNSSGDLQLFVAVDSPNEIFGRNSSSLRLLREARQRGIGLIYSCANPSNLPEIALNNTGTILSFRIGDSKNAKIVAEQLGIADQVLHKNLSEKFSAVVKFSTQSGVSKFAIIPYFQKDQINA